MTTPVSRLNKTSSVPKYLWIGNFRYSRQDIIGEGFSSKVYKGINAHTKSPVAIKLIDSKILAEPIHATLLQSQLKILQQMKGCQNVLDLHSIIQQGQDTYIITQICQTDVAKIIVPPPPSEKIASYMQQLLKGFQQIYRKEIIHRDLKPANLLIDSKGALKIADFGFAVKGSEVKNQTKFNIGSPLYMSPEALKRNQYSHKSDIWSIGIILYQMLTGDTPWKAQNQQQLFQKYDNTRIEQILQKQGSNIPQKFKQFLLKTLQFDRRHRIRPQQIINYSFASDNRKIDGAQQQKKQAVEIVQKQSEQNKQQAEIKNFYIPKVNKPTKTERFYKNMGPSGSINLHKTSTSIKEGNPNGVMIKPAGKPAHRKQNQAKTLLDVTVDETETAHSSTKTNISCTQLAEDRDTNQLTKQQAKSITKNLIYYIHICRLLYKIIVRINECIEDSFNSQVIQSIRQAREDLLRVYCHVIVKNMYRVKNLGNNNFINLAKQHHQQYILHNQFKKVRKVCAQYIDKYSKSQQLKYFWVQRNEPDYQAALKYTGQIISKMWPQLCQKNHKQIILLQFMLFAYEVMESLSQGSHEHIKNKQRIEDYVDTIPNPPSYNRFKRAIAGGKKVTIDYQSKQKLKNQRVTEVS